MSSAYPPYGGIPTRPCQRCGMPLPLSLLQCTNCGWQNVSVQNNQPPGPASFARNWETGVPPNNLYQSAPASLRGSSDMQVSQFPGSGPTTGHGFYNGSGVSNGPGYGPVSPPPFNQPAFSTTGPAGPQPNGPYRQSGALPPMQASATLSRPLPPTPPRRPHMKLIIGLIALVVVIIVGGVASLLFLSSSHKHAGPALTGAKLVPTPTTPPLFTDQFGDNANGWNTQSDPGKFSAAVGGGALTLEDDNHSLLWDMVPGQHGNKIYGDFQLFVDATLSQGDQDNGYGVFIRGALDQNGNDFAAFYRFSLYGDGSFAIFKGVSDSNGTITNKTLVDFTANSAIQKAGMPNHIVISAKGPTMTFIVNGQTLGTVTDNNYASGLVALFVNNLTDSKTGAQAKFSNLAIYPAQSN